MCCDPAPPSAKQEKYDEYSGSPPSDHPRELVDTPGDPGATALSLGEAIRRLPGQYWKVLTKPGATTFAKEAGKARWDVILIQLASYALIVGLLKLVNSPVTSNTTLAFVNQLVSNAGAGNWSGCYPCDSLALNLLTSLVGILIGFFIGQGILFGLAKAFGGQGTFTAQAYAWLLIQVPLGILEELLQLLPIAGGLLILPGIICQIPPAKAGGL